MVVKAEQLNDDAIYEQRMHKYYRHKETRESGRSGRCLVTDPTGLGDPTIIKLM